MWERIMSEDTLFMATIEQARRALVYVRPILEEIRALYAEFRGIEREVVDQKLGGPEAETRIAGMKRLRNEIQMRIGELRSAGVELKDMEQGLCDFHYKRRDGEVICLCFKLEEDTINFWHTVADGLAGRRPIEELLDAERAVPAGGPHHERQ